MDIKKILITNVYSWQNKGDAAIAISTIEEIKKQFPNAELAISTFDLNDQGKYGNFQYYRNIQAIVCGKSKNRIILLNKILFFLIRIKLFEVLHFFDIPGYFLFSKQIADKIKHYKEYDLIVASGGGYLLTPSFYSILVKILFSYDFFFASFFNKPYILFNQSIGPFYSKFDFYLLKKFLKLAKIIICRENLSYSRLKKYGLTNIILSSDIAFNLSSTQCNNLSKYDFNSNNTNIGITVRKWLNRSKQKEYEKSIAEFIEDLLNNSNTHVYFMPQVIFKYSNDEDILTSERIYKLIDNNKKKRIHIINEDLHPSKLKYMISQMDYFIGTRMHSNIFALTSHIKTLAIAYEPKTKGIMKMINLDEYAIPMEHITKKSLLEKFSRLKKDSTYLETLKIEIPITQKQSFNNLNDYI